MQEYFYQLAAVADATLKQQEVYTALLSGEASDFCRLSGSKVRQAGSVKQSQLTLQLIDGQKHARSSFALTGVRREDERRWREVLGELRAQLADLPEDPYLLYATEVCSTERVMPRALPDSREVIARVSAEAKGVDLVGIYAAGGIFRGFANSLGQRNWFETHSFNFDWSLYLHADKAVKTGYAGFNWVDADFTQKLHAATEQLKILARPPRTIKPGHYPVYLAPAALSEVTDMLAWGGFGLKSHRTKNTPLLKLVEAETSLHPGVSMMENCAGGIAPDFNESGYVKPSEVRLIAAGKYQDCLVSPRSAKEYGVATNGAGEGEQPVSLEMQAGELKLEEVARQLGDGIYINNLWYLNFSDQAACRMTGLTRFASFWVEKGEITQPLSVMRFDESGLRMLGGQLRGLTKEREMIMSTSTYGARSTVSAHLPGALIDAFSFTL